MEDEYGSSARLLPPAEVAKKKVEAQAEAQAEPQTAPPIVGDQICLPFAIAASDAHPAQERLCFDAKVEPAPVEEHLEGSFAIGVEVPVVEESATVQASADAIPAEIKVESDPVKEPVVSPVLEQPMSAETKVDVVATEKEVEAVPAEIKVDMVPAEGKVEAAVPEKAIEVSAEAKIESVPVDNHVEVPTVQEKARKVPVQEKTDRPFRVKLRGSVLVLVRLPNKRSVRAAIHQLSTTGGVIHLEKPLDEKLEVEMIFHIQKSTIQSKAQMLFPMWATQGWMQPFRFINLAEASREKLDVGLKAFLGEAADGAAAGT
jgi:hypothetical protein